MFSVEKETVWKLELVRDQGCLHLLVSHLRPKNWILAVCSEHSKYNMYHSYGTCNVCNQPKVLLLLSYNAAIVTADETTGNERTAVTLSGMERRKYEGLLRGAVIQFSSLHIDKSIGEGMQYGLKSIHP